MKSLSHPLRRIVLLPLTLLAIGLGSPPVLAVSVMTRAYNAQRTGANTSETALNASNVNFAAFAKLFTINVDDQVYAQPLIVSNLSIGGVTRNVVYIATVNNSVYAFDADLAGGLGAAAPLWQRNFNNGGSPPNHTQVGGNCGTYNDFSGNMGIVGTPVIDGGTNTLYVVTRTVEGGSFLQRLRALDIVTGNDRVAAVTIGFINSTTNNQRAALALSQGKVYVAWSSHCDTGPYNGRVMAFDAGTLGQVATFNVTPSGNSGGIWMAGAGPVIDGSGNVYYPTGNGSFDGVNNFSESILKLGATLSRLDWFTPSNWSSLNGGDLDLGSSGPILVPGTNMLVMGGKGGGTCYLVNSGNLGHVVSGDTQIPQSWHCVDPDNVRTGNSHHLHNSMVAWNSPNGLQLYTWGENDFGRRWGFNGSTFTTPANSVTQVLPPVGMPGGMMTLSANGSQAGSGVLWVTMPLSGDANQSTTPGVLRAFNAEDLTQQIWNSTLNAVDNPQNFTKGSSPVVANGKVYVPSLSNRVSVYGPVLDDEVETAPIAGSTAGRTVRVFTDGALSHGQGQIIEATAVGDFISFTLSIPHAGNYGVRPRLKKLNNRGIWQLSIDTVNQGAAQDGFAAAATYTEVDLGVRALSAGTHTFRFQVTGKNASSTSFWIALDYIKLVER